MVALGRIILRKPRLLLVDEPCLGLSPALTIQIYEALQRMRSRETSIILVEQNVRRAQEFADRMCMIRIGRSEGTIDANDEAAAEAIEAAALGHQLEADTGGTLPRTWAESWDDNELVEEGSD
jgi:branched-chain amino acid transport system ATP-binding protein